MAWTKEKKREYQKTYYKKWISEHSTYHEDRKQNDPIEYKKYQARQRLNRYVYKGLISRKPCEVCGEKSVDGHHDDYDKPLKVKWLCKLHHGEHHARVREAKMLAKNNTKERNLLK